MPNPTSERESSVNLTVSDGGWCLADCKLDTSVLWDSPPQTLQHLLWTLFREQPGDVLSWMHAAVWELRDADLQKRLCSTEVTQPSLETHKGIARMPEVVTAKSTMAQPIAARVGDEDPMDEYTHPPSDAFPAPTCAMPENPESPASDVNRLSVESVRTTQSRDFVSSSIPVASSPFSPSTGHAKSLVESADQASQWKSIFRKNTRANFERNRGSTMSNSDMFVTEDDYLRAKAEFTSMRQVAVSGTESMASEYSGSKIYRLRYKVGEMLRSWKVEYIMALAVILNSISVGMEASYNIDNAGSDTTPLAYFIIGQIFNVVFFVEVALRIFVLGLRFFTGEMVGWNLFDFGLVIFGILETLFDLVTKVDNTASVGAVRVVRVIRVARVLRVLRAARIVRFLTSLRLLSVQILGALEAVFWALVLLMLIMYLFGMVFAQIASDYIAHNSSPEAGSLLGRYWGSVPRAMYTLYKSVTGGVDWEDVVHPLTSIHWIWVMLFNIYLSFTLFAVMNVVVGVFCQSAIQTAARDCDNAIQQKLLEKEMFIKKVSMLFLAIDHSGDGTITYLELANHLNDEKVSAYFDALGLDSSDAWNLFKLLDKDEDTQIECEEFVVGCLRLRGAAKAIDTAKITQDIVVLRKQLATSLKNIKSSIESLSPKQSVVYNQPNKLVNVSSKPSLAFSPSESNAG